MPGRDVSGTMDISNIQASPSLKAHRAFPRRKVDRATATQQPPSTSNEQNSASASFTNERINSWIPASASVKLVPTVEASTTLTSADHFRSWNADPILRNRNFTSRMNGVHDANPSTHDSPANSNLTPLKAAKQAPIQHVEAVSRDFSDSRTDSFKTAHENISSDGEASEALVAESPSMYASRKKWLKESGLGRSKNIGLGLGLDTDEDSVSTPGMETPKPKKERESKEFVAFDGAWGGETPERIHDQLKSDLRRAKVEATPLVTDQYASPPTGSNGVFNPAGERSSTVNGSEESPGHPSPTNSLEREAEQDPWPLSKKTEHIDAEIEEVNRNRLSQASTNSTVVAAMVFDRTPQRRQTLRHTGKMLDSSSSSITGKRSSVDSNTSTPRSLKRTDRRLQHPEVTLRQSFSADRQLSVRTVSTKRNSINNPLIVIPDRRSSLRSSVTSGQPPSKTFSTTSRQQSSRPTTAPEEATNYFDVPRDDHRQAVSVVIHQPRAVKQEDMVDKEVLSPLAVIASTPSGLTSNALSTATSMTSNGMKMHYLPHSPPIQREGIVSEPATAEASNKKSDPAITGDWSNFRPQPAMVTPFSLRSQDSSTPGTLEVNEATALSIHPHTNKSILVIQEIAGKDKTKPREQSAIIAGNANIAIPGALRPTAVNQGPAKPQPIDSPLQNPREPPLPPDIINVIPPTPANAPPPLEDIGKAPAPVKAGRFSNIKRAVSTRRYSDVLGSSLTRRLSERYSGGQRFSFADDDEKESRLHPSWRPRRFYGGGDHDSDSESEFGNDGFLPSSRSSRDSRPNTRDQGPPSRSTSLSNRFSSRFRSGSLRRPRRASSVSAVTRPATQPLPYEVVDTSVRRHQPLVRRLTGSLRLPRRHRPQPNFEFINSHQDKAVNSNEGRMPDAASRVPLVGFRGIWEKIEKRRETKEEEKREARSDRLKEQINVVGPGEAPVSSKMRQQKGASSLF